MESAKAVGGTADQVLAVAAGIECLHVASLVHDDIIDQDPVRRGWASTAEQYGLAEALVAGDGLSMAGVAALLSSGPAERMLQAARSPSRPCATCARASCAKPKSAAT
ncbi:polyprenyl synthetase family protein [Streptomyces sp. NPDC005483]|uniref:polyprenyl synthetase family protein n=1 Tax=Streptomyces sp. NPDC005483 TaxID=3154882 RepID=UPI0033BB2D08